MVKEGPPLVLDKPCHQVERVIRGIGRPRSRRILQGSINYLPSVPEHLGLTLYSLCPNTKSMATVMDGLVTNYVGVLQDIVAESLRFIFAQMDFTVLVLGQ